MKWKDIFSEKGNRRLLLGSINYDLYYDGNDSSSE